MVRPITVFLAIWLILAKPTAWGLILFSGDNDANQSDPGTGAPFYAVARVSNYGGSSPQGSAVYLRGKYLLTANHVVDRTHVSFDGVTYLARDAFFTPVQIGTADLKIIKLVEDPGLNEVLLADSTVRDRPPNFRTDVEATLVGFGRGRSTNDTDGDNTWTWGGNSTIAKRWGTNEIEGTFTIDNTYNYTALFTDLDSNAGNNEAGLVTYDSGSGLFVEDNGQWYLAGIATLVSTVDSSTFATSGQDLNYFVRISELEAAIEAAIPDTSTFAGWLIDHGLYGDDADEEADLDEDGMSNLAEFASGTDPNDATSHSRPVVVYESDMLYIEYKVDSTATGISVVPEWSPALSNPSWSNQNLILTLVGTDGEIQTWRANYPADDSPVFFRINITTH